MNTIINLNFPSKNETFVLFRIFQAIEQSIAISQKKWKSADYYLRTTVSNSLVVESEGS
jgi:hypothetical protein